MKILIPVVRIIDPENVRIRVKPDRSGVDMDVKMATNPLDEKALEKILRMREKEGLNADIVAVSVGPKESAESLRTALAAGADWAIHVVADADAAADATIITQALEKIVRRERPDLVIMGDKAIGGDSGQIGPMLAAALSWPQATNAADIKLDGIVAIVASDTEGGQETVELLLPALVTAGPQLVDKFRTIPLPNIMKAKKKEIVAVSLEELGVDAKADQGVIRVDEPPPRKSGRIVASAEEVLAELRL